jgi:hypothetical protein
VKVSPTFYVDFMTYHRHFTAKKHRPRWFLAKTRCACWAALHVFFCFLLLSFVFLLFGTLYFNLLPFFFQGCQHGIHFSYRIYEPTVKVSPTFYGDFMTYHRHFTAKKHRPRWFLAKTCCACCIWAASICIFSRQLQFACPQLSQTSEAYSKNTHTCNCTSCVLLFFVA